MMAALTVAMITLGELLGSSAGPHASVSVRDLVLDSRAATAGAAFVALRGTQDHGLRHAHDALSRGAEVVLYDPAELGDAALAPEVGARAIAVPRLAARSGELARKLYGSAMSHVELVGVTGTNGKTTVAYLVAQAMTNTGRRCGYIGTLGHGLPTTLEPHALTTPDCFTLHRELASIAAGGARHAALEVSSHALAQDRIAGLEIGTAAFTNLTRDHLDAHGSLAAYGEAKARLFRRDGLRRAVLNVNDAFAKRLAGHLGRGTMRIRVAAAGDVRGADGESAPREALDPSPADGPDDARGLELAARVQTHGLDGLELDVAGAYGVARLRSPLVGGFNADNLLVALGVLVAWDLPLAEACAALEACTAPPGRFEVIGRAAGEPHVVVDYAHTPDGLERALETARELARGELWCVFGCGGDRDTGKRAAMGAIAAAHADHIVVTDDNPRRETPAKIVRDILVGVGAHPRVVVEHDRAAAIRDAIGAAGAHDVVLIAGKGHETTQRTGAHERPFSDRDVALAALRELG